MLINIGWLKDWVAVAGSADALGEDLTRAGLEVEAITSLRPDFSGVVVAEIREVGRHPQADRLTLCVVDDGRGLKNVVCGAPNAAAGMRAPYARVGARLPGGKSIAATEIRGTTSQGMLCSAHELGLGEQGAGCSRSTPMRRSVLPSTSISASTMPCSMSKSPLIAATA